MTKYLVVAGRPKQFEYHGPFDDLDDAYAQGAELGRDDWEVGDVQSDGVHLRFGKSRAVPCRMRNLLRSCRCQAIKSGAAISTPRCCASCVTGPAGDKRKEAGMRLFLNLWRLGR